MQTLTDLTKLNVKRMNKPFKVIVVITKDLPHMIFDKCLIRTSLERADELNLTKKFPNESI